MEWWWEYRSYGKVPMSGLQKEQDIRTTRGYCATAGLVIVTTKYADDMRNLPIGERHFGFRLWTDSNENEKCVGFGLDDLGGGGQRVACVTWTHFMRSTSFSLSTYAACMSDGRECEKCMANIIESFSHELDEIWANIDICEEWQRNKRKQVVRNYRDIIMWIIMQSELMWWWMTRVE